ncbi:MAG: LPS export ABC transporter periplasmic protein LptC, partial [Acidobacteriota bacterium]
MQIYSVKILRRLLLVVIAGVLAAVVVNYVITWRSRGRTVEEAPEILGADVLRSVQNIEYTERRSGKVQFRLRAEELRETRGGKSLLRGIEAEDVNPDGSVRNRIRSREAEYDRESRQALFVGDVLIRMGQAVELRTESLHYDMAQGLGSTEDPVALESPEIQGSARGLRFQSASRNLELKHELDFHVNRVKVDPTGTAVQNSYRVTAQYGCYLGEARLFRFERSVRLEGV